MRLIVCKEELEHCDPSKITNGDGVFYSYGYIVMFVTANSTTYELDRGNAIRWGIVDLTSTNTAGFSVRCLQD